MQTITSEEQALIISRLQAGQHGFRGRIEIDWVSGYPTGGSAGMSWSGIPVTSTAPPNWYFTGTAQMVVGLNGSSAGPDINGFYSGVISGLGNIPVTSAMLDRVLLVFVVCDGVTTSVEYYTDASTHGGVSNLTQIGTEFVADGIVGDPEQEHLSAWILVNPPVSAGPNESGVAAFGGSKGAVAAYVVTSVDQTTPVASYAGTVVGPTVTAISTTPSGGDLLIDAVGYSDLWGIDSYAIPDSSQTVDVQLGEGGESFGNVETILVTSHKVGSAGVQFTSRFPVRSISLDRSRTLAASQMDVDLENEDEAKGWYTQVQPEFYPNNVIRAYEWHGDTANEVQVFTGILDRVHEHRDPKDISLTARSRMKWLLEQSFISIGSQDASNPDAVRTEDNGVYINKSPEYIVGDILDRAGWPSADRSLGTSGITIDEYDLSDGASWADQIVGTDRLTTAANFDFWDDELGVVHFEASPLVAGSSPTADYTFQVGVDITVLDHETDDVDRATRVKVTGPMTSSEATWSEEWGTSILTYPVGVWYDPSDTANIRVIDGVTKYLYTIRISDRKIISKVYLGGSVSYPLGLSGDPADSTIYWVLEATWRYGTGTTANIHKFQKSDNSHLATYALPAGQWSDLKSDGSNLWLTNYGDGKIYKRSRTDGSAVADYTITYNSVVQDQPTGLYVNGTTLGYFFYGTNRFLLASNSAPTTITAVQSTAGTGIAGGEFNTTSGTELFAVSDKGSYDNAGHIWEFQVANLVTNDIVKWAYDQTLEDDLGFQSQIGDRIHDLHSGDAAHQFEIRVAEYAMKVVNSEAQAQAVADAQLALLERLRRQLDIGTLGNPAIQVNDVIAVTDPVSGITGVWIIDTYRSSMDPDGGYTAVWSVLPWE